MQLAHVDEATLLPKGFRVQLLARLSVPGARLYATPDPDSPRRHWPKTGYLGRTGELNLHSWHFKLADNPGLSPGYVADLASQYVGLWRRRMIDGAWVVAEGAIYDMWGEARHVVEELPDMRRHWCGVDYGTTNPFAAVLLGEGADGRRYVSTEWRHDSRTVHRSMTDAQYSAAVRAWLDALGIVPERTFIDPSAASCSTHMWQDGPPASPAPPTTSPTASAPCRACSPPTASSYTTHAKACSPNSPATPGTPKPPSAAPTPQFFRYVAHSTTHEWRHLPTSVRRDPQCLTDDSDEVRLRDLLRVHKMQMLIP